MAHSRKLLEQTIREISAELILWAMGKSIIVRLCSQCHGPNCQPNILSQIS